MLGNEIQTAAYLFSSILFILSLGGLSSQKSAKRGVNYGILGMIIAIVTALSGETVNGHGFIIASIAIASLVGIQLGRKVEMTSMPQLVAILHSFVGLAAVLVGFGSFLEMNENHATNLSNNIHLIEICVGVFVGAITFTGSIVAWGKLDGKIRSKALLFTGRHALNIAAAFCCVVLSILFVQSTEYALIFLICITFIAFFIGVMLVMAIGGGDMPVVVSMLNSYSGWAAAAAGFMLGNDLLIVTGALVGSSGAILSIHMCKAMNRSFVSVIFGGFANTVKPTEVSTIEGEVTSILHEEAALILKDSKSIIIVPGYGMAVAKAQHPVNSLLQLLTNKGKNVRFAIHPVAGRLPGHMNVLLAEANVPYDKVYEMDEINEDMSKTDLVIVIGANDVVNPAAQNDPNSSIFGMPVIEAWKAKRVIILKRSMSAGYSGEENALFYNLNSDMLYGDAKLSTEKLLALL